jgi:DNA-binding NarL/FixJ family response regulator
MYMHILIADDQPKVRFALRVLLGRQPGCKVMGEAVNAEDLLAQSKTACPDLVLLGWELPGLAAIDPLTALRRAAGGASSSPDCWRRCFCQQGRPAGTVADGHR